MFIENKVQSNEHSNQTDTYYVECINGGVKRHSKIFVYLSPLPLQRINCYKELEEHEKPSCPHYISICYQDILDTIIEPLRKGKRNTTHQLSQLDDYVSCLELPALPDGTNASTGSLSIMATSQYERGLIETFMDNLVNVYLYKHALALQNGESLYRRRGFHLLTDYELICIFMRYDAHLYRRKNNEVLREIDNCNVVNDQKSAGPFIVWSPVSCQDPGFLHYFDFNLYEYRGKAYKDISYALADAVRDYIQEHKKKVDMVQKFATVHVGTRARKPCITTEPGEIKIYRKTAIESLFIHKYIDETNLSDINDILGKGYKITPISSDLFHEIHECGIHNGHILCPKVDESVILQDVYKKDYIRIEGTDFYYRRLFDRTKLVNLNAMSDCNCNYELLNYKNDDIQLLKTFTESHQALIFSIRKISAELY